MKIKKPKISKRSIIIAAILILLLGIPTAYLLSIRNQEESGAWYNSSWLYRRSISVSNSGSTVTNEDVLIEVDTASLITGTKLQADCDDLRFIDSDDATPLSYWVEGGCNTATTHVWVRIPTLNSGGETIYMYYGNGSATNSEQTWTGKFYIMKDSACDSGWTTESGSGGDFYLKFPYPGSSHGTTGGTSSHNNGNVNLTTSTIATGTNTNTSGTNDISIGHNHTVDVYTEDNTSVLPPYLDMIFCSNNDLIVKQNGVAIFTSSVPSGYTRFSALDGLFPRGNSSYGGTSTATTHTHVVTAAVTGVPSATGTNATGATAIPSSTHTHTAAANVTGDGNQVPPYMTVVYGEAASADVMAPSATIVMSNGTPPLGWTRYSALDGYFTYGATTYGTTGGNATHSHSIPALSFPMTANTVNGSTSTPRTSLPRANHTHTTSATTSGTYSNTPPYIQTLFIQKKSSQTATVNSEEIDNQDPNQPSTPYAEGTTNPTGVIDLTPEFSAVFSDNDAADTGAYYEIEVNTNSGFSGTVMWDTGQTATGPITNNTRSSDFIYAGTALTEDGSTYYWRIRFWDNNGAVSTWSTTANFTMNNSNVAPDAPSTPYAEAATNPTKVTDTTPEFSAVFTDTNGSDTGNYYEIEVNTQSDFLGTSMWDTGQVSTGPITNGARSSDFIYAGTALSTNGVTYYWRIRFWDNGGLVSNWSTTQQFTMSGVPLDPTSLLTETSTNPTGVTDLTPEFSAIYSDPNADNGTFYEIEVNTNGTFTGTVMWDTGQTATGPITSGNRSSDFSYAGTALTLNGTIYYWRIRFWDADGGVSGWSATANFTMYSNTVPNAPSTPYAETATNPTKVSDTTPEFSAVFSDPNGSDTGNYYEIEVNSNNSFSGTVLWDSGQVSTGPITNGARSSDFIYAGTTLTFDGLTYYWRIRFWDSYGAVSNWSTTQQFTMSGVPYNPTSPYTEGATNPTGVTDLTPEFSAVFSDPNASDTGTYYEIEVNTNGTFTGTVMWDTTQLATGPITNGARSSDFSYAGTALTKNGTTYYWRIRFWDVDGGVSGWSTTAQFTMDTNVAPNAPTTPLAETATNPTKVTDTTPEFSAIFTDNNVPDTGTYYEIEVNTNNAFSGTVMWDTGQLSTGPITNNTRSSDFIYAGTALTLNGTTYYWRIRFWDDSTTVSNWSTTQQFTMSGVPSNPSALLTEGATDPTGVTDTTPEFSAVYSDPNADNGTFYEIEVNTNNVFSGTVMWDTGQTATGPITSGNRSSDFSYAGTTLTKNSTTYYWRIRFWDADGGVSNWSATAQFTMGTNTVPNAPSTPYAEAATNPTKVIDLTPEFSAVFSDTDAGDTGAYYEIEVNTNSGFSGTVMWDTGQTATTIANGARSSDFSYAGTALTLNGVTYYWRMRFWDIDGGVSNWSTTQQFTMSGVPSNPSALLTEGATNPTGVTDTTPEFSAIYSDPNADNGTYYEVEVNTASNFGGTVMWDSGQVATGPITSGNRSSDIVYAGTTLTKNSTTYYWRIRFWDADGGVSGWATTAQFTMGTNTVPNAPSTPYAEAATNPIKVTDLTPEFSAIFSDNDAGDTGAYYEIEVNTASNFGGTVMWDTGQTVTTIANGARSSDFSYAGTALTLNGLTYYWRIRFWDIDGGVSNWSTTQQFTMSGVPNNPTALLTEGATNPTGVTDLTPEFSAIYSDPNTDNGTYYEIEVNTNGTFTGTVMWDTGQLATGPITNNTRSSDFSYAGTALSRNSTTYYWRIRFWDADGGVSGWATTAQFTMATNTTPNAPSSPLTETLTNPDNVSDTTPEFSAIFSDSNPIDVAPYYEIEVNTASDFTGTVMWDSNQTSITPITNGARSSDISYAGTALTFNGTIYYWRMRFWDDTGAVSGWSATAQFKMSGAPNAPTTLLTEGEATPTWVTDYTPDFSAIFSDTNTGDTGVYYEIDVNTNNTFSGTVMWASTKTAISPIANNTRSTDITYAGTTLTKNGATYYWRIRFWDAVDNVSNWSSTSQFTMADNLPPSAPTLMYTEGTNNPSGITDLTPEFSAVFTDTDLDDIGAYYSIDVNSASDFTGSVLWSSGTTALSPTVANGARSTDISYAGSALTRNGTTYYWRIKFGDGSGAMSPWSATRQFTMATNDIPNAPSALYTEGTTNPIKVLDTTPEFSAIFSDPNGSDTGVYYEIHVNTASDFSGTVMWASTQTAISAITNGARSTDISYAGTALTNNGALYYWRIRFWDDGGGVSNWSTTAQFRMPGAPNAPTAQTVDGISNPVEILSITPTFAATHTDNNGDNATYYEVEVNSNSLFTGTVMWDSGQQAMTSTPNGQITPGIIYAGTALTGTSNTIYYWRIRLWDSDGNMGAWSTIASFVDYIETNEWVRMEGLKLEGLSIN